jgi:hypothetical protein
LSAAAAAARDDDDLKCDVGMMKKHNRTKKVNNHKSRVEISSL